MDAREVERCIEEFGTDVYRFCLKLCENKPDAEDLYQQTFLQALRSREDTEEDFLHKELLAEVNQRIETLPDKIRIPFTLYYLFEFSIEQTGDVLGKPPGTIKSRLHKGRQLMKKGLEEAGYEI